MANALGEFLGGVASAIRDMTGDPPEVKMKPVDFADKIRSIETGKDVSGVTATAADVLVGKTIVDASGNEVAGSMPNNGRVSVGLSPEYRTYTVPRGYHDGTGSVSVNNTGMAVTPSKEQQTVSAAKLNQFLHTVVVNPIPDEYQDVSNVTATADDVKAGKVFVDAEGNEVEGALTGTLADVSGVTAKAEDVLEGKVIVDSTGCSVTGTLSMASTGGGSLPKGAYWEQIFPFVPYQYSRASFFNYQGKLYVLVKTSSSADTYNLYDFSEEKYTAVKSGLTIWYSTNVTEYKGEIYMFYMSSFYQLSGANQITKGSSVFGGEISQAFVYNDKLCAYSSSTGIIYQWDESSNTWSDSGLITAAKHTYGTFFIHNNELYRYYSGKVYKYVNGVSTQIFATYESLAYCFYSNGYLYIYSTNGTLFYKYDVNTGAGGKIGTIPQIGANGYLYEYDGEVRAVGGNNEYRVHLKLHEITE